MDRGVLGELHKIPEIFRLHGGQAYRFHRGGPRARTPCRGGWTGRYTMAPHVFAREPIDVATDPADHVARRRPGGRSRVADVRGTRRGSRSEGGERGAR